MSTSTATVDVTHTAVSLLYGIAQETCQTRKTTTCRLFMGIWLRKCSKSDTQYQDRTLTPGLCYIGCRIAQKSCTASIIFLLMKLPINGNPLIILKLKKISIFLAPCAIENRSSVETGNLTLFFLVQNYSIGLISFANKLLRCVK